MVLLENYEGTMKELLRYNEDTLMVEWEYYDNTTCIRVVWGYFEGIIKV